MIATRIVCVLILMAWVSLPLKGYDLPTEFGVLQNRIESMINALPDKYGNDGGLEIIYEPPTENERIDFAETVFRNVYYEQYELAATNALTLGYRLVEFFDTDLAKTYYILERNPGLPIEDKNLYHWGIFVFNPEPVRGQLVIQAPHPLFDSDTGLQANYVFQYTEASFLFIAGTHRCNKATPSGCSGSSSVCSPNSAPQEFKDEGNVYRQADVAHATDSMFDVLTRWLEDELNNYYFFIQLHGFGQDELEPDAILSNGVDEAKQPVGVDYLSILNDQIKLAWADSHGGEQLYTEVGHIDDDHNFSTLLATSSVQGRYLNGGSSPCTSSTGTTNLGHFLHIEQGNPTIGNVEHLRSPNNWMVMSIAIINTFIEAPLPVELLEFNGRFEMNLALIQWKTLWEEGSSYFEIERSLSAIERFESLAIVKATGYSKTEVQYNYKDFIKPSISDQDIYYRLKQVDFNGIFKYSEIVRVSIPRRGMENIIYPNYGDGQFITLNNSQIRSSDSFRLVIYSQTGKVLFDRVIQGRLFEDVFSSRLRSYPVGYYYIRMSSPNFQFKTAYYKNL